MGQTLITLAFKYKYSVALFLSFASIYILQTIYTKPDAATLAKYHLTSGQATRLSLTIALPYIIIWLSALVGYLRLKSYSSSISKGQDGLAFRQLSYGIMLLFLWLPFSTIMSNLVTHFYNVHSSSLANSVRFNNYLSVLLLVAAFALIYNATNELLKLVKPKATIKSDYLIIFYLAFAALYCYVVFHDPARATATGSVHIATYYSADWIILLTLVIPRVVMWYLGLKAVYNLYLYRQQIKGKIYKEGIFDLAKGIGWVVLSTAVLRIFQSFSSQVADWGLAALVLVVYFLLIMIALGYIYIARGAKQLQLIEDT